MTITWSMISKLHFLFFFCRYVAPLITTVYFCGVMLGGIIFGSLSDRYGRKYMMLVCLYTQCLIGVGLHFVRRLVVFIGLRFIQGIFIQVIWKDDDRWKLFFVSDCLVVVSQFKNIFYIFRDCNVLLMQWSWNSLPHNIEPLLAALSRPFGQQGW